MTTNATRAVKSRKIGKSCFLEDWIFIVKDDSFPQIQPSPARYSTGSRWEGAGVGVRVGRDLKESSSISSSSSLPSALP